MEPYGARASRPQKQHKGWHSRGYLPHYDSPWELQSISFRLCDAVPAHLIVQWKQELACRKISGAGDAKSKALHDRIEFYEDAGYGKCFLRDSRLAELVENALLYFDAERYDLLAWCIMPNHVHSLIKIFPGEQLGAVIHSWKSFTSKKANEILKRHGQFWMEDYYDRFVRDEEHLKYAIDYIEQNPVKAGLVAHAAEWRYSSASKKHIAYLLTNAGRMPALPD